MRAFCTAHQISLIYPYISSISHFYGSIGRQRQKVKAGIPHPPVSGDAFTCQGWAHSDGLGSQWCAVPLTWSRACCGCRRTVQDVSMHTPLCWLSRGGWKSPSAHLAPGSMAHTELGTEDKQVQTLLAALAARKSESRVNLRPFHCCSPLAWSSETECIQLYLTGFVKAESLWINGNRGQTYHRNLSLTSSSFPSFLLLSSVILCVLFIWLYM